MRKGRIKVGLACLGAALVAESGAADDRLEILGAVAPGFFMEMLDVEVDAGRAFVFGVGGLIVVDVTEPIQPVILGHYLPGDPDERFYRGAVGDGLVYGAGREHRISVVDVDPPDSAFRTAVIGQPGMSYEGLARDGGHLYACRHGDGLEVFSLTDPAIPVPVAEVTSLVNAWDVAVRDGWAFVADGGGGLAAIEVSDPTQPVHRASVPTSGTAVDIVLVDDLAVVACGSAGAEIFDITDPRAPQWRGIYDSSGLASGLAAQGTTVFLADWDLVEAFDVTEPESPNRVGWENTPIRAMGLAVGDGRVFVSDWSRLRVYEFGPTATGDLDLSVAAVDFGTVPAGTVKDTTFAVANTGGGPLHVSDIQSFNPSFRILGPMSFTVAGGEVREIGLEFSSMTGDYDATFLRLESDDRDEATVTLPVSGNPDPNRLDLGEPAAEFALPDLDGTVHTLTDYRGKVVVLAFFANW